MEYTIKPCVGIVSYLPDDPETREVRRKRLDDLLIQIDKHWGLPIIIIAQNWKEDTFTKSEKSKIILYSYQNKLGITKARSTLRDVFLQLAYTHIILLDDDLIMSEDQNEYDKFLRQINNSFEYFYMGEYLNNFSCLSRKGFMKVNYDNRVNPEEGTGFEDWIFFRKCKKYLTCYEIKSNLPAKPRKYFLNDKYSTWVTGDAQLKECNEKNSREIIRNL